MTTLGESGAPLAGALHLELADDARELPGALQTRGHGTRAPGHAPSLSPAQEKLADGPDQAAKKGF